MKIHVIANFTAEQMALLKSAAPGADFSAGFEDEKGLEAAEVLIGNPPLELLPKLRAMKWLQLTNSGADQFTSGNVLGDGVLLTNSAGAYGLAVSDHLLAFTLMLFRHFHLYRDLQHEELWKSLGDIKSIEGSTAVIVGLGDIGCEYAKRFKQLGGHTIGIYNNNSGKREYVDELHHISELDAQLPRADIVALCVPSTAETRGMFSAERLSLMRSDCYLINVGRGDAIDTMALHEALSAGRLAGAALDVTSPEPLPEGHPLWQQKKAMITPHVAGNFHLPITRQRVAEICAANLGDYISNPDKLQKKAIKH